jgi:hypothetical protein
MFGLEIVLADIALEYPREVDKFIMQVLFEMGYQRDILRRLNQVPVSMQILFLSDILTASGHKINHDVLSSWPPGEEWSTVQWPNQRPNKTNLHLWQEAMSALCPCWCLITRIRRFTAPMHKIWRWTWDDATATLHQVQANGVTTDVFVSGQIPNRFPFLTVEQKASPALSAS